MSPSGYKETGLCLIWMTEIFVPGTIARKKDAWRLLLFNGYESRISAAVFQYAVREKILLICLSSHAFHLLQPLDVGLFGTL